MTPIDPARMTFGHLALTVSMAALAACGGGPTAPSGTDLAGRWQTDAHNYSASGQTVSVRLQFVVAPGSGSITSIQLCNAAGTLCTTLLPDQGMTSVPISGSRFELTRDYPNITCDGTRARLELSGSFRSATRAEGDWKDTNHGPPGYAFCGTTSFGWAATKG